MSRHLRLPLSFGVIAAACAVLAATGRPDPVAAASVTLTEHPASPFVAPLGGDPVVNPGQSSFTTAGVSDVTGDGRPEIIVGSLGSRAHVYRFDGSVIATLDPGTADPANGRGAIQSSPALADLDGDGIDDVVLTNLAGRIAAYSLAGGQVHELYNRFVEPAFDNGTPGLFATPALGYLDRDTQLDAVTAGWGQTVDGWSGPTGVHMPQLRQWVKDTIWSSPAIGDIDNDGQNEIVVGGDCEGAGSVGQPCSGIGQGGYVWAFNLDGSLQWSYFVRDAVVWSSPALIDLNHDGALDVVVGTGVFFDREGARRMRAIDGASGQLLWEAETPGRVVGSPAVAMVNGEAWIWAISEGGSLTAWNSTGQQLWRSCISDQPCNTTLGTFGGVALADVNDDGRLDAIAQGESHLRVLDAMTGALQTYVITRHDHPLFASYATPTVVEVDGTTHIIQVGLADANGGYQIDAGDEMVVTMWTTGTGLGWAPWPTFKQNMARTSGPLPTVPDESSFPPLGDPDAGSICFDVHVGGDRGDAAVVNLTPVLFERPGNGVLVSSDTTTVPLASNVNYTMGAINPSVAIAPISDDGNVCYVNSRHSPTHLVADHLGTIMSEAYIPATASGAPSRRIDTRVGLGTQSLPIAATARLCFAVAGDPGDVAIVNLTPVEAQFAGDGQLVSSDVADPPVASNVNYQIGSADPNVAFAPIGSDGQVCFVNSRHAAIHLVADHLGTIRRASFVLASPTGAPVRKLDTRRGLGGTMLAPGGRVCMPVTGSPGDAAVINLTPVEATGSGNAVLVSSDVAAPKASNVNFGVGTASPNVAIAPIGSDGQVCVVNSAHASVHMVADHLGTIRNAAYAEATPTGAPSRALDTRVSPGTPISPS